MYSETLFVLLVRAVVDCNQLQFYQQNTFTVVVVCVHSGGQGYRPADIESFLGISHD